MWLLVIVLLTPVPGLAPVTVLNEFATKLECQQERNRIGFDMAASYPMEHTFNIDCVLKGQVSEKLKI